MLLSTCFSWLAFRSMFTATPERVGVLWKDRVQEFLDAFARNGSRLPLPSQGPARTQELHLRIARVSELLTRPFGLVDDDDVLSHLELVERYVFKITTRVCADPVCVVLEPPEFYCTKCSGDVCLITTVDKLKAPGRSGKDHLHCLTDAGVMKAHAYVRTCRRCDSKYFYDRVVTAPSHAQRMAGQQPTAR